MLDPLLCMCQCPPDLRARFKGVGGSWKKGSEVQPRPCQFSVAVLLCPVSLRRGLGMVAAMNEGGTLMLAEPVHGTPPHLEGTKKSNPIATMRAAVLIAQGLAPTLGVDYYFEKALEQILREGTSITPDLGGTGTTDELGSALIERFAALMDLGSEETEHVFRDG